MKFRSIILQNIIWASLALVACSKHEEPSLPQHQEPSFEEVTVQFGGAMPQTRSSISVDELSGRFSGQWEAMDRVTVFANEQAAAFAYQAGSRFFEGSLVDNATAWTYQALSPYVAEHPLEIPFSKLRQQRGSHFNGAYDPMISTSIQVEGKVGQTPDGKPVSFDFKRLTSILALTFTTSVGDVLDEDVLRVELRSQSGVLSAKNFVVDRDALAGKLSAEEQAQEIVLTFEAGTAPKAAEFKAYFNIPAGDYTNLKAVVTTRTHRADIPLSANLAAQQGALYYASKAVSNWTKLSQPTISWQENEGFTPQVIEPTMSIHVLTQAQAGIRNFVLQVKSPTLYSFLTDPLFGFTPIEGQADACQMDLAGDNPGMIMQILFGESAPTTLKDLDTPLSIDLSTLVPMILELPNNEGQHLFTLQMTDHADRSLSKTLTFEVRAKATAQLAEVDLWQNTGLVRVENAPSDAALNYRRVGETAWNTTTYNALKSGYEIKPEWIVEGKTKRLNSQKGLFAGGVYEWQILQSGAVLAEGRFDALASGATIPTVDDATLPCYSVAHDASKLWDSGNNSNAKTLCNYLAPYANLQAGVVKVLIFSIFTPGNLFTGDFAMSGTNGAVSFGKKFDYRNARPSALNLTYQATIGTVDKVNHKKNGVDPLSVGAADEAMIMVCIVDWAAQHKTTSGMSAPTGIWSPETLEGLSSEEQEGLIAYGVHYIKGDHTSDETLSIPLHYYKDTPSAPAGNYTIVISCATSRYGDYLNGCSTNNLKVKNFEWKY